MAIEAKTLNVEGMSCSHCENAVKKSVGALNGVKNVSVDLKGLDIGADDYVTKPFSPRQIVARVKAILRRFEDESKPVSNQMSFNDNDLFIDIIRYEVKKNDVLINITPNEYKLLMTMIKYPAKVFTREELISLVLGEDFEGFERTIDAHIKNLRQKIETDPKNPKYILTVHGVGYRFGGE